MKELILCGIAGIMSIIGSYITHKEKNNPHLQTLKARIFEIHWRLNNLHKKGLMDIDVLHDLFSTQIQASKFQIVTSTIYMTFFLMVFTGLKHFFNDVIITLPFIIPKPVIAFPPWTLSNQLGWFGYYLLCAVLWNLIFSALQPRHQS